MGGYSEGFKSERQQIAESLNQVNPRHHSDIPLIAFARKEDHVLKQNEKATKSAVIFFTFPALHLEHRVSLFEVLPP